MSPARKAPRGGRKSAEPTALASGVGSPARRPVRILYVEDRPADVELALEELRRAGLDVAMDAVATLADFRARLQGGAYDVVLSDYSLEGWTGMEALDALRALGRDTPFLLVTGSLGDEAAVDCLKRGVADYVTKDRLARLPLALQHALEEHTLRRREAEAGAALREREERLRQITENIQEVYHLFSADGSQTLYVSPAYEAIFGRSSQTLYDDPLSFVSALHPDDRPILLAELEAIRNGQGGRSLELRVVWPDGQERWILARAVGVKDAQGVVQRVASVALDITDRKRTEDALAFRNVVLSTQQEATLDGILVVDDGGKILFYNRRFIDIWGIPADLVARGVDRAVLEAGLAIAKDPEAFRARVEYLYEHRDEKSQEEVEFKDGRTIERYSAPMFDAGGRYYGRVWYFRDITERKRAEEALRWEQFLMRTLMETIPDPIYFKDTKSRFQRVNRAMALRCGARDAVELIGKTDFDVFARDHAEAALRVEREILRTGEPAVNLEEEETWPDRPSRWVSTTKMPLRDADGAVIGTFGISRDITERRRAEELLRRSEADFRSLVEGAPVGIYRSTRSGRFLTVNPALIRMLGYQWAEELLQLDIARDVYADPAERERFIAEAPPHVEVAWKRRDGTRIMVQLTSRAMPPVAGGEECYEGVVVDVTEQRSLENQFRQAQRLEAVGRLAGGVAHDFNNVLTAITGYTDLLLEDLGPEDPKRPDVEEIKAAALRAAALTRQLLAFSRKQVLQTRVLDLNDVVRTLEKMLRRLIGEDVKLELALAPALGAVRADPGQIEQVIMNLAVNARDAMPSGGRLTIETANVELDDAYAREHAGAVPGRYVMLAVSDTGVGMDAETQAHIFEPFFTTKEQGKGTGLGLATVYGIVKQSGGYVWVYSEPGRGATFKIYLPRVGGAGRGCSPRRPPSSRRPGGARRCSWPRTTRRSGPSWRRCWRRRGYRVLRAPDGQAALAMARAHAGEIHLLVTDLVMPGMTGPRAGGGADGRASRASACSTCPATPTTRSCGTASSRPACPTSRSPSRRAPWRPRCARCLTAREVT